MKFVRLLLVGAAAILLLAGCGDGGGEETARGAPAEKAERQESLMKMRISMEGYASPPDSGILLADRLGYFTDAGFDMTIWGAIRPEYAITYASEATNAAVVTQMPEVVRAEAEGEPVTAIGSVLPEPTMAMIWLPESGIEDVADLQGKTIAIPGTLAQRAFLAYVLKGAGLTLADVKLKKIRYNAARAIADGRADAVFGASWSADGPALEARGLEPVVTKATDLGIPPFEELVLATNPRTFAEKPKLYRRVLALVNRGAIAAARDPEAASEAIVDKTLELASPKPTLAGVEATAPLLSRTGRIDRAKLKRLVDWMYEQGMVDRKPSVSQLIAGGGQ
jgi:putative hydroxymethylpyrimidine transport system substrate-binding protein